MCKWVPLLALLALLITGCGEEGRYGFTFINQGEHIIESGQIMTSDTAVAGGNVTFEEGSELRGSIYLLGGTLTVNSRIEGDVAALGGSVTLGSSADIAGDFYVGGSDVTRSPGATIAGEDTEVGAINLRTSPAGRSVTILAFLLQFVLSIAIAALLAGFVVRLMPSLTNRLAATSTGYPLMSGALGLLLLLVLPMLLVFMVFTIVLIPGTIVGFVVLGVLVIYGFVGLGRGVGERVARSRGWTFSPAMTAAIGAAGLAAALNLVIMIPIVAEISLALVSAVAIGSVVLSGLGRRVYEPPDYELK